MTTEQSVTQGQKICYTQDEYAKRQYWNKTETIMQKETFTLTSVGKNALDTS